MKLELQKRVPVPAVSIAEACRSTMWKKAMFRITLRPVVF